MVPTSTENPSVRASTSGLMEAPTSVTLRTASSMEKAGGKKAKANKSLFMKENTLMIRKKASVSSDGPLEMFMRGHSRLMRGTDMEKWSGLTRVDMKATGLEVFSMAMVR